MSLLDGHPDVRVGYQTRPREAATKPVIGVSTYEESATWRGWHRRASLVPADFLGRLAEAGAVPVLLPPYGADAEAALTITRIDGLLLVGGADIDPARYGATLGEHTGTLAPARDVWEAALLRGALVADLPVLGVCRGMQLLNVVLGGSLSQHLPDEVGNDDHQPAGPVFAMNAIRMLPDELPGTALGQECMVACYHHQAVWKLGRGVIATGWAADGTIETISAPAHRFAVGVQWHPEVGTDRRLFRAFAEAARQRRRATTEEPVRA